jgi:hypothetical protein
VAPPHFLAPLSMLHELVVELDASTPGVTAEEVLEALAAILACLPHCRRGSAAPRLQLCLRVVLPEGGKVPELEAFRLQHLLHDVGLLPHCLESVQVRSKGMAGLPKAGWATRGLTHLFCSFVRWHGPPFHPTALAKDWACPG